MKKWSLNDIPWDKFEPAHAEPVLISLAKSASLVEYNSGDYEHYLHNVFSDDDEFKQVVTDWAIEEKQHGQALAKWAELAEPSFNFEKSFAMFKAGYQIPLELDTSVRGSRSGELVARCVVETGTSSYYTAIKDYTQEPVLKVIAAKIAADELRHYKLFYDHLKRYLEKENIGFFKRFRVALSRIIETEDDELSYAYYAAHYDGSAYDRAESARKYSACAYRFYRKDHIDRMTGMVFKAIGLKPHSIANRAVNHLAWNVLKRKAAA